MRVAVVQSCSTDALERNLESAAEAIRGAAAEGSQLVALPENFAFMRREGTAFPCAQGEDGEIVRFLRDAAARHKVWLVGGTFPELIPGDTRVYNTCLVFSPEGQRVARYRKMHLFDVDLGPEAQDSYRESHHFAPGEEPVAAETPFGSVALSVCYDLRFPELYRHPVNAGAAFVAVPSAFMPQTGRDHWEVLLRARAIEGLAFVLAPAQCGRHAPDRASYGHSMIIDPWGRILAEARDEPTVLVADCDLEELSRVRAAIPALSNRQLV